MLFGQILSMLSDKNISFKSVYHITASYVNIALSVAAETRFTASAAIESFIGFLPLPASIVKPGFLNFSTNQSFMPPKEARYDGSSTLYPLTAAMAAVSGYKVEEPSYLASFGGMKDWFVEKFKKPGFTIEAGRGKNPINDSMAAEAVKRVSAATESAMLTYDAVM